MTNNGDTFAVEPEGSTPITRDELRLVLEETEEILSEMKEVINVHGEVLACHKYVLEKFVPKELYSAAVREYYKIRQLQIDIDSIEPDASKQN